MGSRQIYEEAFRSGTTFPEFLEGAKAHRQMWHGISERARIFEGARRRVDRVGGCWRLLALADDWCGDAVSTLPHIHRLVDASEHLELRIVPRDRFPRLRDRHLTGGARAIPIVIALDDQGVPRGTWGPRPSKLQARVGSELRDLPKADRYREVRRWYARDRGRSTADEIAGLVERTGRLVRTGLSGTCEDRRVA